MLVPMLVKVTLEKIQRAMNELDIKSFKTETKEVLIIEKLGNQTMRLRKFACIIKLQ